jgi:hypothetical protein
MTPSIVAGGTIADTGLDLVSPAATVTPALA